VRKIELKIIDDHAPKTIFEYSDWLKTMACVDPHSGERRMPTDVDDAVFEDIAEFIENSLKEIFESRDEITRLTQENERMRRENADLLGSLGDLYNLISDSNAPTFIADADYDKITNAAVLISLATPISDPAGGMPVETIWYETRRNEEPDGGTPLEVKCIRCQDATVEPDFNGYCPVCHDDMCGAK
jgi:hypothetical protein